MKINEIIIVNIKIVFIFCSKLYLLIFINDKIIIRNRTRPIFPNKANDKPYWNKELAKNNNIKIIMILTIKFLKI